MANEGLSTLDELLALRAAACDWRLSRGDIAVYSVLLMHTGKDGESFPGPTRVSEIARLAKSNVKISLEKLQQLGYIEIKRAGERKKNRYRILDSPPVRSQKTVRIIAETCSKLGLPTSPVLGLRAAPVGAGVGTQSGPAGRSPSGPAGRFDLGLPAGHELAFKNSPRELSCASRSSIDSEKAEQQSARPTADAVCKAYREALGKDHRLVRMLEKSYWAILQKNGLIEQGRQHPLVA